MTGQGARGFLPRLYRVRRNANFVVSSLILSTDPHAEIRDGARALTLALRATELTARQDVTSLDTLAAAQAELVRFPDAVATAAAALTLARAQGERDYVAELEHRLALYREKKPFRSPQ